MYSHKCEVLGKTPRVVRSMGRILARQVPKERRSGGSRGVELTLQPLALEGATPMWQKFQHFAVDIPRHHREAERVRWALHIYTALLVRLTTYRATVVSLGYRLVNVLYRTLQYRINTSPLQGEVLIGC